MAKFNPKPFGKYFLIDKLATGGMAEIYKAKTFGVDGFEKLLAIKRILPHCSADKEFIHMLIDEAKLSVLLSHTNIVQVYDLGKVGDDYFISMEFINGVNLREFLNRLNDKEETFPEELVTYIISEVCKGLDYAHSKKDSDGNPLNIVHRDISPQNILLSFEGEVKIVDFGIAKAAMNISHTMAGILKGKISYMSPEQALGKPIDRQTDIFSTGLMFYELLTGEKFFRGETQFEVLKKIRTTRINENSFDDKFSDQVKKILAKSLSYSVKERYDTAGDMQIDLTRYLYTTYADFTPRKLSNLMRKIFASEIETKKAKDTKDKDVEPQTRSVLVSGKEQENIVHREHGSDQTITGTGKQSTHTFIESFISGKEEGEAEPSITRTRQGAEPASPPPPPIPEGDEEITGQMTLPPVEEEEETAPPTVAEVASKPKKRTSWGKILAPIAAILFIGGGLWSYYGTEWFRGAPPPPPEPKVVGSLNVQSVPDGAKIFINDQATEFTTPAIVPNLAVEEPLKITLKKPKHKEWTQTLTLADPNPVTLNPTLEVIPVGTLKVTSTPPGAKILIDGEDSGKVTPTTFDDLPLSQTYNVKLELDKHRPVEQKITLYSLDPIEFDKKLEEIKYGSVKVTTSPSGAKVYLNNNDTGKTTPTTISELEVGKRYTFRLARNGYRDAFRSVDIEKEGTTNVRGTLAKVPEKPKEETQTVKQKLDEAAKKLQELEKEKAAELAKQREAQRKKEQEQAKKEQPKETPKEKEATPTTVAYVSVGSSPKGADVFINGVKRGSAPGKFKVDPGKPAEITVSKSGLSTVTRVVTVRPGETRSLGTIKLGGSGKESDAAGIIVIDSNPPGAMVLMNGAPQRATPLRIKGLRPGQNVTFTVKKDGYKSWSRSVTVGEGSKSFMANLKKN